MRLGWLELAVAAAATVASAKVRQTLPRIDLEGASSASARRPRHPPPLPSPTQHPYAAGEKASLTKAPPG